MNSQKSDIWKWFIWKSRWERNRNRCIRTIFASLHPRRNYPKFAIKHRITSSNERRHIISRKPKTITIHKSSFVSHVPCKYRRFPLSMLYASSSNRSSFLADSLHPLSLNPQTSSFNSPILSAAYLRFFTAADADTSFSLTRITESLVLRISSGDKFVWLCSANGVSQPNCLRERYAFSLHGEKVSW